MKIKIAVTMSFVALLAMVVGSAQAAQTVRANIPFQFVVEGKALPAGEYDFVRSDNELTVRVISQNKGPSAVALVLTRLGQGIHTTQGDAHVVFDKIGDTYFLSELWIPELDGYLFHATKQHHEHRAINIPS